MSLSLSDQHRCVYFRHYLRENSYDRCIFGAARDCDAQHPVSHGPRVSQKQTVEPASLNHVGSRRSVHRQLAQQKIRAARQDLPAEPSQRRGQSLAQPPGFREATASRSTVWLGPQKSVYVSSTHIRVRRGTPARISRSTSFLPIAITRLHPEDKRSVRWSAPSLAVPCRPLPSLAVPCRPLPSLAVPCRPLPSLAVPCRPLPSLSGHAGASECLRLHQGAGGCWASGRLDRKGIVS